MTVHRLLQKLAFNQEDKERLAAASRLSNDLKPLTLTSEAW